MPVFSLTFLDYSDHELLWVRITPLYLDLNHSRDPLPTTVNTVSYPYPRNTVLPQPQATACCMEFSLEALAHTQTQSTLSHLETLWCFLATP